MKKSSLIKKMTLALALLLGAGGVATGLSLRETPTQRAEAGTGPTYTISQKQAYEASGTSYGIFSWWGGASWQEYGTKWNCFASTSGKFMSAYHANLNYATKVTVKINFVSCDSTDKPSLYLKVYSKTSSKKTLVKGNNTLTWNLPKDVATDDSIEFCFDYPNATSSGVNYLYFNGHDATTPFVTIETNEAGRNVTMNTATGVKSVYLSTTSTATSGSASGTKFNDGATVYGFVELAAGYKHQSNWTKVSGTEDTEGAKYRVGSITVSSSASSISYTAPSVKTKSIARNGNGGSSGSNVTLTYGQSATVSALSRTGYTFTGWNTNAAGTGTAYTTSLTTAQVNSIVLGSTSTLYAQWNANKYTVSLNKNNGTGGSNSTTATYASAMPTITAPTRTGYTFEGYYDSNSGGIKYYNANGTSAKSWDKTSNNSTLYARWTPISKNITLNANGGSGDDTVVTLTYDTAKTLSPSFSKVGHSISSWNTNSSGTGYSCGTTLSQENVNQLILGSYDTLYAQWSPQSYLINYKDQNGASFSGEFLGEYPQYHTYGTTTELVNPTKSGYNFEGWYFDSACEEEGPVTELDAEDFTSSPTVYAKWSFKEEVQDAIDAIDAIGEVEYTPECRELLDEAREAYEALDDYDKPAVSNYQTLVDGEQEYIDIRDAGVANAEDKINAIGEVEYTYGSRELIRDARSTCEDLSEEQKSLVDPDIYQILVEAESTFDYLKYEAVDNVEDLINAIGKVKYNETSKAKINAARNAFDNSLLDEEQEAFDEEIYKVLTDAEELYQFLMDNAKAQEVRDLINAIGEVEYTPECKDKIDTARNAFEALTQEQKDLVGNIKTLKEAEATYAHLEDNYYAAKAVDELIDAIGEVVYTQDSKDKIDAAREAYEALTEEQKPLVEKLDVLEAAEAMWEKLVEDNAAADAVDELIDAIGEVEFTEESKALIDAAREGYEALTDDQKPLVDHLDVLEAAEAAWDKLVADHEAADAVDDLIDAIGEVEFTEESKALIDAAREGYDALTDDQKPLVDHLDVLEAAEAAWDKLVADHEAADAVDELIDAIGEVEFTEESKALIDAAREGYDALTDDQKPLVDHLDVLEAAEAAWDKLVADHAAADAVEELIEEIGKVTYTDESKEKIDAAREAYEALTDDQKALIDEEIYEELTDAEELYKLYDDNAHAEEVRDLIDAIGEVEYTDESKEKIDAAREAFDALTDDQKDLVGNVEVLEEAEERYEFLKENHEIAEAVDALIDAIGEVEYTDECKEKIDAARDAYEELTDDQKELVTKYDDLVAAEEAYAKLVEDTEKANEVEELIDAIGEVEYTPECKELIDAARDAYEELTEDQQALVENYQDLVDAEEAYAELEADHQAAEEVEGLIEAIGEVEYTPECEEAIDAAREAYEALTDAQKELVSEEALDALEEAEAAYKELDDNAHVDAFLDLLEAIGEVEYTPECKDAIDAARDAYEALTEDQKALVSEEALDLLEADEARYQELEDLAYAGEVMDLIDAIGEVEYTEDCKDAIDTARDAYEALTEAQKELVENYDVLVAAEERYAELKADHEAAEAVEALIDAIGEVEYTEESKALIDAAREGYDALTDSQKELVNNYQDLLDAEEAWAKLVIDHAAAEHFEDLVEAIGEVEYTPECKDAIDTARDAYEALTEDQKALVSEEALDLLEADEARYQELEDLAYAGEVIDLIDAIGEVEYTEESKEAIDAAREAYEALTEAQKELVENYDVLVAAEERYAELKADHEAAEAVEALIDAIGEVEYTEESEALIDAAREGYDALTNSQKELVNNYQDLLEAEAAWAKLVIDHAAAEAVEELINNIGEVVYTEECKVKIDAARDGYEALIEDQQPLVRNYQDLLDAEAAWNKLVIDHEAAEHFEDLVEAIGEVEYTPDCEEKINAASEAYEALTDDQKDLVSEGALEALNDAINEFEHLKEIHEAAEAVEELINNIGEVVFTDECCDKIVEARGALEHLSDEEKELVSPEAIETLVKAEEDYANLLADHYAAKLVEGLIDNIGEVEYTDDSCEKIERAREAYEELTDEQKQLVAPEYLETLLAAEEEWDKLVEDHARAREVTDLINHIGEVKFDVTSLHKIEAARDGYDGLTKDQKVLIDPDLVTILEQAEATYAALEEAAHRAVIEDEASKVKTETADGSGFPEDITLKVEVKTSIKAEEGTVEYEKVKGLLLSDEYISHVYDVKLIQVIGGIEREVQPSDIKEGMAIYVHIKVPAGFDINNLKVLHIHSEEDIEVITNAQVVDGEIVFTVTHLSEFAFVSKTNNALPGWAIALIVIGGVLVLLCLCYLILFFTRSAWIKEDGNVLRGIKWGNKDGKVRVVLFPCRVRYRLPDQVFSSKEEACK